MNFIKKAKPWITCQKMASAGVARLLAIACTVSLTFCTGTSIAQATTNLKPFAGIWRMTLQDKRVGTLELMNYNGQLTGSITNARAIPGGAPIVQASISQGSLVINTEEADERITTWNMTLTGEGKGRLELTLKGHEMGPFQLERISWEELASESGN
jgi:hypothetical protein